MEDKKPEKKKGFFSKLMDKLDKKLTESSHKGCCCSNKEGDQSSCSNK